MMIDALIKKNFWIVNITLGAGVTYGLASATNHLVASKYLGLESNAVSGLRSRSQSSASAGGVSTGNLAARQVSARSILEGNPFDSVTGPFRDVPAPAPSAVVEVVDDSKERLFPVCVGAPRLSITMVDSAKPAWSFAVFSAGEGPGASKPMVREGGSVGGRQVAVIVREKVYLREGASYCHVTMFAPPPPPAPPPVPTAPPHAPGGGDPMMPMGPSRIPPEIEKGIQKVDDTNFNIDRIVVDKIIENQAELMKTARIVPETVNGKVVGIRLLNIRPDTLLGKLGMQAGDQLRTINGFDMTSPEKALEAYAKLRTAPQIQIGLMRGDKPVNLEYAIK